MFRRRFGNVLEFKESRFPTLVGNAAGLLGDFCHVSQLFELRPNVDPSIGFGVGLFFVFASYHLAYVTLKRTR